MSNPIVPPQFPGHIDSEETSTVNRVSTREAEHQRSIELIKFRIYRLTAYVFLVILVVTTIGAGYLLVTLAVKAEPQEQRLVFGVIGGMLGVLWSHFGKLVEQVSGKPRK